MSYIFHVYRDSMAGIIEISAKDPEDAIKKVTKLGFKFSAVRKKTSDYKIQYAIAKTKK